LLAGYNFLTAIVPAIGYCLDGLRTNRCTRLLRNTGQLAPVRTISRSECMFTVACLTSSARECHVRFGVHKRTKRLSCGMTVTSSSIADMARDQATRTSDKHRHTKS